MHCFEKAWQRSSRGPLSDEYVGHASGCSSVNGRVPLQGDRKRCHRTHASLVAIKDRVAVPEARVDDVSNLNLNP